MTEDKKPVRLFDGVFLTPEPRNPNKKILATVNLTPGKSIYGESLIPQTIEGLKVELRSWDPFRSKLAASILNRLKNFPFVPGSRCLYLGASTGTTVSHVSDVLGSSGKIFAVEVAPRVARELMENVIKFRRNVIPLVEDANHPERYGSVYGDIGSVYCDIAQPDQTEIAIKNCEEYLAREGYLFLVVKASSIDALKPKNEVISDQINIVQAARFNLLERIDLEPFDRNHAMLVARKLS